jgi:hypothetical protein
MTNVLGSAMQRGQAEPWMFELALALANDTDDDVVREIVDAASREARHPIELPDLVAR